MGKSSICGKSLYFSSKNEINILNKFNESSLVKESTVRIKKVQNPKLTFVIGTIFSILYRAVCKYSGCHACNYFFKNNNYYQLQKVYILNNNPMYKSSSQETQLRPEEKVTK